jgi:hypothetical protein
MQENTQDWLELEEGDSGFRLLTEEEFAAIRAFCLLSSALRVLLNFQFICFLTFLSFKGFCCLTNFDEFPESFRINEDFMYL